MLVNSKFYWEAFQQLITERPQAMGALAQIPWSAIRSYAEFYGLEMIEAERFIKLIQTLDKREVYLVNKKVKSD